MKIFFLFLVVVFMFEGVHAVQPVRKPFLLITIDGKPYKSGEILTVQAGQKLMMGVEMEGGRRDFCKFPDTYADIAGTAQILSRGSNGLAYQLNGKKAEWKLLNEKTAFLAGKFARINSQANQSKCEITISNEKFTQTSVNVTANTSWQFSQDGKTMQEENFAGSMVYIKLAGSSDRWFLSPSIQAGGMKNDRIQEKLIAFQAASDSIEDNFYRMKLLAVQHSVQNLQAAVNSIKSTIDEVKMDKPEYQISIVFVGLPSDNPNNHISVFATIKNNWILYEPLVKELSDQLGKLPALATKESKDELVGIIGKYADWQYNLPENTFKLLSRYIPDMMMENIQIPGNIHFIAEEKTVTDYTQTLSDFNDFLDQRIQHLPDEIQKISLVYTKLQAVRLYDGMFRNYFTSINWAKWKKTGEEQ